MDNRGWLKTLMFALAAALAANALLGPLAFEVIEYHYSETIRNQGIGLDLVSLVVVAPLAVMAGILVVRHCLTLPKLHHRSRMKSSVENPASFRTFVARPQPTSFRPCTGSVAARPSGCRKRK